MTESKKQNPPDPAYRASGEAHAGPSFSLGNRLGRLCWGRVQTTLFQWSPRPFHGWRRFPLRLFGAKIARSCHIYERNFFIMGYMIRNIIDVKSIFTIGYNCMSII